MEKKLSFLHVSNKDTDTKFKESDGLFLLQDENFWWNPRKDYGNSLTVSIEHACPKVSNIWKYFIMSSKLEKYLQYYKRFKNIDGKEG